jgi:dihydroflavonol-4-reductase
VAGRVFLTGASGFVGGALLRRLLADGRQVRALTRSDRSSAALNGLGAEPVAGDLMDPASLRSGMEECEVAFHAGGVNEFCLADPTPMFRVNVEGSASVVRAAADAGVQRVVYTSSAATIGEPQGTVADERTGHRGWYLSNYERSKREAEGRVLDEAERLGVDVVCVNPSSIQGPGRTGGTARILLAYARGKLRTVVDTRLSFVDVDDSNEGHMLAERRGEPGQRYLLNGATMSVRALLDLVGRETGSRRRVVFLPGPVALAAAAAVETAARAMGKRPPVCREMVKTVLHGHAYDGSRASRELGLQYTPAEETVRRTLAWYREHGYLGTNPSAPGSSASGPG